MTFNKTECGIEITALEQCKLKEGIQADVLFRVPYPDTGIPDEPSKIPNHIAMVVMHYTSYTSCKPFYEIVMFEDDVTFTDGYCEGRFRLNVMQHIPFEDKGEYEIIVSLGVYLSDIIKVTVS
ncbi:MAG: hypothetical protein OEY52_08425 [Gammaproteobacteria bacterium]|nr:hypothetical protein [Gammaproteobacteria bacterium]